MKKWTWTSLIDVLGLAIMVFLFVHYVPSSVLSSAAPTGGDTGSHFWPFKLLMEHGLPEFRVKMWNPGNLMGEPIFVHYFPLPYFWMALLYPFMSMAAAFKVGSLMGAFFFPLAVYWGVRGLGLRFPAPLLAAAFSLFFSFNESFSQWGGNNVSTLSGQFAHQEALMFLFLWIGATAWELRNKRKFALSALLGAAVCCTHSYVFLLMPFFCLSFLFFYRQRNWKERFWHLFWSGIFMLLLSAWFLVPMLDNNAWVSPMAIIWGVPNFFRAVVPDGIRIVEYLAVLAGTLIVSGAVLVSVARKPFLREALFETLFWGLPIAFSVACYWIFPKIGLVDVRAIPQVQVLGFVWLGLMIARGLTLWPERPQGIITAVLVSVAIISAAKNTTNFPYWIEWNDSGWETKPHYYDLLELSKILRTEDGVEKDFSSPRVAYEHNELNGQVGTPRVFEMLPYFANRATLESVYLQATITATFAFYNQALISITPSCPFRQIPCPGHDLKRAIELAPLLGVSDYIFVTEKMKTEAKLEADSLVSRGEAGMWEVYSLKQPVSLIETMAEAPIVIPNDHEWRNKFFTWLSTYKAGEKNMVVSDTNDSGLLNGKFDPEGACKPNLTVQFNRMRLTTSCPGTVHYIKFAYHPSWKTSTGDEVYLVSPGYMAVIPSVGVVDFEFGQRTLWKVSSFLSLWALLFLGLMALPLKSLFTRQKN